MSPIYHYTACNSRTPAPFFGAAFVPNHLPAPKAALTPCNPRPTAPGLGNTLVRGTCPTPHRSWDGKEGAR
jgi:hypothetical protein